jgi:hypothetical protein
LQEALKTAYKSVALPTELCRHALCSSAILAGLRIIRHSKPHDKGAVGYADPGQVACARNSTLSSPNLSIIAPAPLPGGSAISTK